MDPPELRLMLSELGIGAKLSDTTAGKLASLLSQREFAAGKIIFEEGADNPWLYFILSGEVGLEMCVPARGCTRILTLGPGDLLAWSALLGEGRMTATAIALSPTRVLAASGQEVRSLCDSDSVFGYEFMREMAAALSKRLVATRLQLLDLYDVSGGRQSAVWALA
jgi:CRP/FNR family cyclic AMP-dependent transcriptional regulator